MLRQRRRERLGLRRGRVVLMGSRDRLGRQGREESREGSGLVHAQWLRVGREVDPSRKELDDRPGLSPTEVGTKRAETADQLGNDGAKVRGGRGDKVSAVPDEGGAGGSDREKERRKGNG